MTDTPHSYPASYFIGRDLNDYKRMKSYVLEKQLINKYVQSGVMCDVGCGTGEFHEILKWDGLIFGMEVSDTAKLAAENRGVNFSKSILTEVNFFDLIVFRGVIQHLSDPFGYLASSYKSLKPGGFIVFLMTPNADSISYKLFGHLPLLDSNRNFWTPSSATLSANLTNLGFKIKHIGKPYWRSPYRSLIADHFKFVMCVLRLRSKGGAFWGNAMELVAQKPNPNMEC